MPGSVLRIPVSYFTQSLQQLYDMVLKQEPEAQRIKRFALVVSGVVLVFEVLTPGRPEPQPLPASLQVMQTISRMAEPTSRTEMPVMNQYNHRGM